MREKAVFVLVIVIVAEGTDAPDASRNLIHAGLDRGTAMSITGHLTEHVFERYNIKTTDDRKAALLKVGDYAKQQAAQVTGS